MRDAHSCREEVPHDEGQLFAVNPKNLLQVSPIDRALQLHFSTLEKTRIDHNPLLTNLVVTVSQVSPIYHHLQQIFQDLDIHRDLAVTRPLLIPVELGFPLHSASCRTEVGNVKQGQQMIPFISCEIPLCQDVCELVFGVDVFDLVFGV